MTLDELGLIYFEARKKRQDELCARHEDDINTEPHRAGIRAVVKRMLEWQREPTTAAHAAFLYEILASDGVEAAGTDTAVTETMPEAIERSAPAAGPVCEWTKDVQFRDAYSTACGYVMSKRRDVCICSKTAHIKSDAAR